MDRTCKNCGNVFGEYLTVCPSCGTPVEAEPAAEDAKVVDQQPEVQAEAQPQVQQEAQPQQQAYQQQAYQQQAYQQQPYQQQAYQQQPYQQQPYQQQPYQQTAYQQPVYGQNMGAQQKSKLAAGLLGIFLGGLGVHNFYLGFTGKAVAQLLISLLSCGTLVFVSAVWGFIEGILILTGSIGTDATGMPLGE